MKTDNKFINIALNITCIKVSHLYT